MVNLDYVTYDMTVTKTVSSVNFSNSVLFLYDVSN